MMVNELKNNNVPWQSTVPSQMPWMRSYDMVTNNLQFGHSLAGVGVFSGLQDTSPQMQQQVGQPSQILPPQTTPSLFGAHPTTTSYTTAIYPVQEANKYNLYTPLLSAAQLQTPAHTASVLQQHTQLAPTTSFSEPFTSPSSNHPDIPPISSSLTYLPGEVASRHELSETSIRSQKRTSVDMDDDLTEQRPTKQLLSEKKLFRKFGSLHLNNGTDFATSSSVTTTTNTSSSESDDSDEETRSRPAVLSTSSDQSREEFNRYVYLLFKDRNQSNRPFETSTNATLDRLAREERDKLSKAVVLWTPPLNPNPFGQSNDDCSSDDEFTYSDYKDFLKQPTNSCSTIQEVADLPQRGFQDEMMFD